MRLEMTVGLFLYVLLIWTAEGRLANSHCDLRYYQHYEIRDCSPVIGQNGCPEKFECSSMSSVDKKVCLDKGRRYQVGEHLEKLGPCDECQCGQLPSSGEAFVSCAQVDCPDWQTQNKSCYMGYSPDACCPKEICPTPEVNQRTTCTYQGKTYRVGQYVTVEDPCRACICTKDWEGPQGPGCWDVDCLIGQYAIELRDGCLPVYYEKGCCPRQIHCDGIYGSKPVDPALIKATNKDNLCHYKGDYYDIKSTVFLEGDKYKCVACTCSVPPDFTCIQKSCPPPPPRSDCRVVYGHCCPEYECPS